MRTDLMRPFRSPRTLRAVALAVALLLAGAASVSAQTGEIRGTVVTAANEPAVGAHVFVPGTTYATAVGAEGQFSLVVPAGTWAVSFSRVGFESQTRETSLGPGQSLTVGIVLAEDVRLMDGLVVRATLDARERRELDRLRDRFEKTFLGETRNRRKAELTNVEAVTLERTTPDGLRAVARDPVVMENRALGYRVSFHDLRLMAYPETWTWTSKPRFEELAPASERERRRWQRAREQAYEGSLRHFLAAAVEGRAAQDGFRVLRVQHIGVIPPRSRRAMSDTEISSFVVEATDGSPACLRYYDVWAVGTLVSGAYAWSWLELRGDGFCDVRTADLAAVPRYGEWSKSGAADLLPHDYRSPRELARGDASDS